MHPCLPWDWCLRLSLHVTCLGFDCRYLDSIATDGGSADEHKHSAVSPTAAQDVAAAPWRERNGKLNSTALRICNNNLLTLKGLDRVAHHLLDDPSEVQANGGTWPGSTVTVIVHPRLVALWQSSTCTGRPSIEAGSKPAEQPRVTTH
jgi:hypothetical protein